MGIDAIIAQTHDMQQERHTLENSGTQRKALETKLAETRQAAKTLAERVADCRLKGAKQLAQKVSGPTCQGGDARRLFRHQRQ